MSTDVSAAVMTGKGVGAISTIQVFGKEARIVIEKIFRPLKDKNTSFEPGKILLGDIKNGKQIIDQVIIGCEGAENFAINCHGNPLIVSDIMQLLSKNEVKPVTAEQIRYKILSKQDDLNTIAIEAKLTLSKVKTLAASKLITSQIEGGLNQKALEWSNKTDSLEKIKSDAEKILEASKTAKLIISGCKVVLAGPANSGKSTLFNRLIGRQKAIVTDIKGTTRDWVSG
ncbi:MAG: GTPase, partial [Planctomycetota bacterium]